MNLTDYALQDASEIRQQSGRWITISHIHGQTKLEWGHVVNGRRETKIQTITYHVEKDGTVSRSRYSHV